jgi:membrane associated rhomboid family serine protease
MVKNRRRRTDVAAMSQTARDPLESILLLCAAAAPHPWYPRDYSRKQDIDPQTMDFLLEELWLEGLIQKAGSDPSAGPGVTLTERGQRLLLDPAGLERLRNGKPLVAGDRGAHVRQVLRSPARPVATRLLVLANLAVFGYGLYLAQKQQVVREFTSGVSLFGGQALIPPKVNAIWQASGAVTGDDLIAGQWWRLLTAEWVHLGLMHLAVNMLGLYLIGRQGEAMWGRIRYLLIYFVSGLASVCVGLAYHPAAQNAGASGAICGLMGAEIVWVLCNGRHLPRGLRRRAHYAMVINVLLLTFISWAPRVSGWGHFGGLAAGAAASLLFQVERFGPRLLRVPAAAAAVALVPAVAFGVLERAMRTDPAWQDVRKEWQHKQDVAFEHRFLGRIQRLTRQAEEFYARRPRDLINRHPTRRDAAAVEELLPEMAEVRGKLTDLAGELDQAGPRFDPATEEARLAAREYVTAIADLYELTERCLRAGKDWTPQDGKALKESRDNVVQRRRVWQELLQPGR